MKEFCEDICAINLLNSILASGRSRRHQNSKPVAIPPPSHLAVLATLVVHPIYTTRIEKTDHLDVSSLALGYLRSLLRIAGPINADFRTAFQFLLSPRRGRRLGYNDQNDSELSDNESDKDEDRLKGRIANEGSLWSRGRNFWSTVGWGFNCSTLYPKRWRYWKAWLEFMVEVLDDDWKERLRQDNETWDSNGKAGYRPKDAREQSMIAMYLNSQSGRRLKGIVKALFADGTKLSSSAFQEVFDKEPRGLRKESNKRKRSEVLDLEHDKFGDYFDEESISSGVSEPPTPQKPRDARKQPCFGTANASYVESIPIRLKLFKLVSAAVFELRKPTELMELYETYSATVKVLPIETFSLFVNRRSSELIAATKITIMRQLFEMLLPSSAKHPSKIDRESHEDGSISTLMLEHCYVRYPANTIGLEDNAKLSLVVENAIHMLWEHKEITSSASFADAVEEGIRARQAKAKKIRNGRKGLESGEAMAQDVLTNSADRIRNLLELLEAE